MVRKLLIWELLILCLLVSGMAVTCLLVIERESISCDEIAHITAGMSYLQLRDARMNTEHPPLLKILAAFPLVVSGAIPSYDDASWTEQEQWKLGNASFRRWKSAAPTMVNRARIPMICITLLLGVAVFFMARFLAGVPGGILSLILYAGSPFFLAYGPLVLTDIGLAFFALLTIWAFAGLWSCPSVKLALLFGVCLAGALLSKFSSGLLLPTLIVLGVWLASRPTNGSTDVKSAIRLSVMGLIFAAGVVYTIYTILFWRTDVSWLLAYRVAHSVKPVRTMQIVADILRTHPMYSKVLIAPLLYSLGVGETIHKLSRVTYLLGKIYPVGTWRYFPVLFLYKMTPGFLCLVVLLLCLFVWYLINGRRLPFDEAGYGAYIRALITVCAVYGSAALLSPINIGIRHLSVPIAALTVLISLTVPMSFRSINASTRIVVLSIVASAAAGNIYSAISVFPNYFSYFNSFIAGEEPYKIAADSNLDLGQSMVQLGEFMRDRGISSIALDVMGTIPDLYLPEEREFHCEQGLPRGSEWVAVGANRLITGMQVVPTPPLGRCEYLFQYPHWPIAGGALYAFRVGEGAASIMQVAN